MFNFPRLRAAIGDWCMVTDGWQRIGRPGSLSVRKHEIERNWANLYGAHRIVWSAGDRTLGLEDALQVYEDGYYHYFHEHPEELAWITTHYADVYDNNPSNVHSGLDYAVQEFGGNHYQDIAIRRVARRLGMPFIGDGLLEIRTTGIGARWGPGEIPLHDPTLIPNPELPGWWRPESIESYWQSAKYLEVRDPRIDLDSADIWFVTGNQGKAHGAQIALGNRYRIGQVALDIDEDRQDVERIAKHKARVAYSALCRPVIVDDSGFCIPSLDNWPGHHVKRELKAKGLDYFRILANHGHDRAYWIETVAYLDGTMRAPELFTTHVPGRLIWDVRGDPGAPHVKSKLGLIFIKDGCDKTVAEWSHEEHLANQADRWERLRGYLSSRSA